jgi:hypothetical protein
MQPSPGATATARKASQGKVALLPPLAKLKQVVAPRTRLQPEGNAPEFGCNQANSLWAAPLTTLQSDAQKKTFAEAAQHHSEKRDGQTRLMMMTRMTTML